MSANLWKAENVTPAGIPADGIYRCSGTRGVRTNMALDRLSENQTFHYGFSVNPGADDSFNMAFCYRDAAGNVNYAFGANMTAPAGKWTRVSASAVVPSGMTVFQVVVCNDKNASGADGWKVTSPCVSYGSPVTLASDAHTPYATQDHLAAEYATKAALRVTSDAVTAEVTERGRLAGRVGTLESTTGTHTSRLQQLAASITSLVRGESTYTDPDGKSATSGIYSLVEQTRDSVTALFGQYTKTEDLASTAAVQEAKKAGTDAASSASAAASAASAAQSTADGAKATADGLATMIRQDADGITVGKSADGETWSTGRTRMGEDSFDVLDKAGKVLSSFGASLVRLGTNAAAILLAGILRVEAMQTHPATAGGSQQTIDTGRISVPVHAEVGAPWSAIELAGRNDTSGAATTALRAEFSVDGRDGSIQPHVFVDCGMTVDGTLLMSDEASTLGTRKGLRITQGSKVCHGHGTPWVTLFESWDEFQSTTGCYDSGLPTLVTMNGDFGAFDGALSDCEIRGGDAVYVMARTTDGPHTLYSGNSVRINWICIW